MLRVSGLRDERGGYYLADLAGELAPLTKGPTPAGVGRWTGEGAAALGLRGPVGAEELSQLLEGRHPVSGARLAAGPRSLSGYDLTFAAPKSVSVLWGTAGPEVAAQVVAGHREAVAAAVGYVGHRAAGVRRGSGGDRVVLATEGLVAATFTHGLSRALDPHLHSHVVVANVAQGTDGRWTALDSRGFYAHRVAAGQLYDATLRHQLSGRLGVAWRARPQGNREIEGIGPEVLGAFSSRRAEIDQHRAEMGGSRSGRASRLAWAVTRDPKVATVDPEGLRRQWSARASAVGLALAHREEVLGRSASSWEAPEGTTVDEYRFAAALARSPHDGVARRGVVAAWAEALDSGAPGPEVERCADALAAWGEGIGVAERYRPLGGLVPPNHQLRALGVRPANPTRLAIWQAAAADIDHYRTQWGVDDRQRPLGIDGSPSELARLPIGRLADHLVVARRMAETRHRLGREMERAIDGLGRHFGGGDR